MHPLLAPQARIEESDCLRGEPNLTSSIICGLFIICSITCCITGDCRTGNHTITLTPPPDHSHHPHSSPIPPTHHSPASFVSITQGFELTVLPELQHSSEHVEYRHDSDSIPPPIPVPYHQNGMGHTHLHHLLHHCRVTLQLLHCLGEKHMTVRSRSV